MNESKATVPQILPPSKQFSDRHIRLFFKKVNKYGPIPTHRPELGRCWVWTASRNPMGYGQISRQVYGESLAHRFSFIMHGGIIQTGFCVLHHCDNPACVNPTHLWHGTRPDNVVDMDAKGRRKSQFGSENHNAIFTEKQIYEVKKMMHSGMTAKEVSKSTGINLGTLYSIKYGPNWSHVIFP